MNPTTKNAPRRRRARPLLIATAGAALLGSGACGFHGVLANRPEDLSGVVEDLTEFGLPDLAPPDAAPGDAEPPAGDGATD